MNRLDGSVAIVITLIICATVLVITGHWLGALVLLLIMCTVQP